jgi:hypothetical protein
MKVEDKLKIRVMEILQPFLLCTHDDLLRRPFVFHRTRSGDIPQPLIGQSIAAEKNTRTPHALTSENLGGF